MLRFIDSFDHYGTSTFSLKWNLATGSGNQTIVSGGRTNNCAQLALLFLSPCVIQQTFDNQTTWIVGVAVNWTKNGVAVGYIDLYDGATRQLSLCIDASGHLYIDKGGTAVATSTNVWVDGWNFVEIKVVFGGASGVTTVRVNGATWITYTGNVSASGNDRANIIRLGDYTGNERGAPILKFDDLYICDGSGTTNNDFLGNVTVDALYPTAAGSYSQFTPTGSTQHYNCVNEHPPDGDTTYLSSQNSGVRDSFTFTGTTSPIITTYGVQMVMDMRLQGTGSRSAGAFVRSGTTNYDQTGFVLSSSYSMYSTIIETNPATSAAWTSSDIAALEAGPKVTA